MTEIDQHYSLPDENDRASAIEHAMTDAASKRSQEPDKDGTYSILDCLNCGNEIGDGRLRVSIKNTICLECAHAEEQSTGRYRR
jgi:RNA polymerase-binding transcription factor DksA